MKAALLAAALLAAWTGEALAVDENAAMRTLKRYKCFNCHSVTREKDGPSYEKVAEKYRNHPDARQALYDHLTKSKTVTVKGKEESHTTIKSNDAAEINNIVDWIMEH